MDTGTNLNKNNDIILQGITKSDLIEGVADIVIKRIVEYLPENLPPLRPLMDRKEAASYLNISLRALDDLTKNGKIKYSKINSAVRFRQSDLEYFINKNEVKIKSYKL